MHANFHCYNWAVIGIFIWTDCLRLFFVIYKLILFMIVLHVFTGFLVTSTDKRQLYVTMYAKTRHLSKILIFEFLPAFSLCIIDTQS